MYRMLIVDDEPEIANWIETLFSTEYQEAELEIHTVYSSMEALKLLSQMEINLLMTDIKMPEMSGMELMKSALKKWKNCQVIFLTGYDYFDYTYTALKYENVQYLLKTESDEIIMQSVTTAIGRLQTLFESQKLLLEAQEYAEQTLPIVQKNLLLSILNGQLSDSEIIQKKMQKYQIHLDYDRLCMMASIQFKEKSASFHHTMMREADLSLLLEKTLPSETAVFHFPVDSLHTICLFQFPNLHVSHYELFQFTKELIGSVQQKLFRIFQIGSILLIGRYPIHISEIPWQYALMREYYYRSPQHIEGEILIVHNPKQTIVPTNPKEEKSVSAEKMSYQIEPCLENLSQALETGNETMFESNAVTIEHILLHTDDLPQKYQIQLSFILVLLKHLNRHHLWESINGKINTDPLLNFKQFQNDTDLIRYGTAAAQQIFHIQNRQELVNADTMLQTLKSYIKAHLNEELTLSFLGELVHLNSDYLSRFFKQYTDMNLSDYIANKRMELSMHLLSNTNLKIQEIAQQCGYRSSNYFIRIFKAKNQITPQTYRMNQSMKS